MEKQIQGADAIIMGWFNRISSKNRTAEEKSAAAEAQQGPAGAEQEQYVQTREQKLQYAEDCCDQMLICQRRLEVIKKEYHEVNHYLTDISTIENLEGEVKDSLQLEARRIRSLGEDKKSYKASSVKMSEKKYEYIAGHEKEMPDILKDLKDSEDEFNAVKNDLHNIEGEKAALKYERNASLQRMKALRKLLLMVLAAAAIVLLAFAYGQFRGEYDYTIGFYIVIVTAMSAIAIILALNKAQEKNLRIAELKLNKAIGLLNRYKLRYVNIKSSLDYLHEMYGVTNSYELSNLWRTYLTAKKEREAYFQMSDKLYQATENYMNIIQSLRLYDPSVWSYQSAAVIEPEEMDVIKKALHSRRDNLKKNLDYNNGVINKSKEKIRRMIEEEPELANDVLAMIDDKENTMV